MMIRQRCRTWLHEEPEEWKPVRGFSTCPRGPARSRSAAIQTRLSANPLALQNRLRRTGICKIMERGSRFADPRHAGALADSLHAGVSEFAYREFASAAGGPDSPAWSFRFLYGAEDDDHRPQRNGVRFRRTTAPCLKDQELRGRRHCMGGGRTECFEAFLRRSDPDDPKTGIGNLGDVQSGFGGRRCLAASRYVAAAGVNHAKGELE